MKVRELMTTPVATCDRYTDAAGAAVTMWEHDCGLLPVIDQGRVVGVVTDRDVCMAAATQGRRASEILVRDLLDLQDRLHSVGPDDSLGTALEVMGRAQVRRLPVVNEHGELEGVLSINDAILAARNVRAGVSRLSYETIMDTLQAICRHRSPGAVEPPPQRQPTRKRTRTRTVAPRRGKRVNQGT